MKVLDPCYWFYDTKCNLKKYIYTMLIGKLIFR